MKMESVKIYFKKKKKMVLENKNVLELNNTSQISINLCEIEPIRQELYIANHIASYKPDQTSFRLRRITLHVAIVHYILRQNQSILGQSVTTILPFPAR